MSDPEVHVEAPGRHHWIIDQRIIDTNIVINLSLHRYRLQHRVHVNQSSVIQGWTDLRERQGRERERHVRERDR